MAGNPEFTAVYDRSIEQVRVYVNGALFGYVYKRDKGFYSKKLGNRRGQNRAYQTAKASAQAMWGSQAAIAVASAME